MSGTTTIGARDASGTRKVSGFTELVTGRHANDGTRQVPASGLNHCVTEVNFFYVEVTSMRVPG